MNAVISALPAAFIFVLYLTFRHEAYAAKNVLAVDLAWESISRLLCENFQFNSEALTNKSCLNNQTNSVELVERDHQCCAGITYRLHASRALDVICITRHYHTSYIPRHVRTSTNLAIKSVTSFSICFHP